MILKIENVSKRYGSFEALHNVNMEINQGEVHGLIGENGSGKTTLMKCVTGIYKPDYGMVTFDGVNVYDNPDVKKRIGYVADNNTFFSNYRLGRLVKFYGGVYDTFDEERFIELNQTFNLDMNKRVSELSKGQKMRLAFMINMALRPEVLMMDEPTSGLDAMAKKELFDIMIEEVEQRNMTVLISSHNLTDLEKICDSVTILKNGTVFAQNELDEVMKYARKLQFVFAEGAPEGFLSDTRILSVRNVGNIYTVIYNGITDEDIERLKEYNPVYMEEININLEEVFVYTGGGADDIKGTV